MRAITAEARLRTDQPGDYGDANDDDGGGDAADGGGDADDDRCDAEYVISSNCIAKE